MIQNDLSGIGVALITPFNESKSIDFDSLINLVNYIKNHIKYLVILGTTSEISTLNPSEKKEIINVIKTITNIPLVIGVGGNNTLDVIKQIKEIKECKTILSVCPYYNKPSQEGIYQHFRTISKNTDKNIIIYNVPSRTGVNIEPETVINLAKKYRNIIAIKEASGDILQIYNLIKNKPKNFQVISGDDNLVLPIILGGGSGVISVIAQAAPNTFAYMLKMLKKNNIKEAYKIYYKISTMINLIFKEGNPVGIKLLMNQINNTYKPYVRLPLYKGSSILEKNIKKEYLKIKKYFY
jgi:4-hydroxy-tetrahydrodipicolinate synthase